MKRPITLQETAWMISDSLIWVVAACCVPLVAVALVMVVVPLWLLIRGWQYLSPAFRFWNR